jgi:RNA polymerase sigma-70 factor (ECF subfamily)
MRAPSPDDDLLERAIAGEPLALDRLLLSAYPRLAARIDKKLPRSIRSLIAAEDILQETFAEAFRGIRAFRPSGKDALYRWLVTIADHRVLDAVRAHKAAKRGGGRTARAPAQGATSLGALIEMLGAPQPTPSRAAGGNEAAAALQVALAGLHPEYRDALTLRYLHGLPVAEVAVKMGKTESAVHKLCSRGLQRLRESMGEASSYLSRA